jgi:CheY-like chemotaxis protein
MKRICVLQVEDTDEDIQLMGYAFEEAGIGATLRAVTHGQAAIDYLSGTGKYADRTAFPLPHLILLDLKMPGLDGVELLRWIRTASVCKNIPVIVLTSSAQEQDVEAVYSAGANAFVTKPSGVLELIELLGVLKSFWLQFTQLPSAVAVAARQAH